MAGLFITLEGIEGAGKTTQIPLIKNFLEQHGHTVICVREPGGTPLAEDMRAILKTKRSDDLLCDRAELLLMYAARAQLAERVIKPALAEGKDVLCDRHDLSTLAYQGGGRRLPLELIDAARLVAIGDLRPDITFLLDVEPAAGMARIRGRGSADRFESEALAFFERVRAAYLKYAQEHPEQVKTLDTSAGAKTVTARIFAELGKLAPELAAR